MSKQAILRAALGQDFGVFLHRSFQTVVPGVSFAPNWHLGVMGVHLDACRTGSIKRLMICLPPRHLKSICASYAGELALKHARDCRSVMQAS